MWVDNWSFREGGGVFLSQLVHAPEGQLFLVLQGLTFGVSNRYHLVDLIENRTTSDGWWWMVMILGSTHKLRR